MADAELEQIRKARLEQLKAQGGAGGSGGQRAGVGGAGGGQDQAEMQKQQEGLPTLLLLLLLPPVARANISTVAEARKSILDQILHPEAADRLGRIRLVKEQRATDVENRLIMLARTGQLRQKVTEDQLKELLSAMSESSRQAEQEKIVVSRRKGWDDDDDDDLLDL
ncbi:hypothetical protein DL769_006940 [Monosporascus sp. CRB-8-3]|nr:hypothetical protein DL769_006940 [Monosporascus sp. CRB-8-3]